MAENSGLSVSDVAALSNGGFGGFGGGFEGLIYLAVIAAMFGGGFGFGGFGNGAGAAVATGMATCLICGCAATRLLPFRVMWPSSSR